MATSCGGQFAHHSGSAFGADQVSPPSVLNAAATWLATVVPSSPSTHTVTIREPSAAMWVSPGPVGSEPVEMLTGESQVVPPFSEVATRSGFVELKSLQVAVIVWPSPDIATFRLWASSPALLRSSAALQVLVPAFQVRATAVPPSIQTAVTRVPSEEAASRGIPAPPVVSHCAAAQVCPPSSDWPTRTCGWFELYSIHAAVSRRPSFEATMTVLPLVSWPVARSWGVAHVAPPSVEAVAWTLVSAPS